MSSEFPKIVFIDTEMSGFHNYKTGPNGKDSYQPNYNDLLKAFRRDHPYKSIADMKAVYIFNGTHYVDFTPIEIKAYAESHFKPEPPDRVRQEFYHKILYNHVARKDFFTHGTDGKINFKNGVLDLETNVLGTHSPEYGFRHVLPYDYNPLAECPHFWAWVKDVMLDNTDLINLLQEFMGYVIRGGEYKYHKALWLSGNGRNGKSTFIDVLKALIGVGNYSTLSIRQIVNDKFSAVDLDGKIANFSEETSPEELADSGPFKNLTGDGEIHAQKKYGDPYSFRNRAKLIMSYNDIPMLKDLSQGMRSRPIIIPWKKDLSDESSQDKTLKGKLLSELPGIFNFALEGWTRLERMGRFTDSADSKLEMQTIVESSCSAFQFIEECVQFYPLDRVHFRVSPKDLYAKYCEYEKKFPYGKLKFFRRIGTHPEVAIRKRDTNKSTEYFAMGMGDSIGL